jgi:hypothetical protein
MDGTEEHHLISEVRLREPKSHGLPHMQITDLKSAVILLDMGHTKGRPCMGGIGQGKETKT